MIFPRASAMVREDLWEVMGLCGTGSDSYSVTDLFVPTEYSVVPRAIASDQQLPEGVRAAEPDRERREKGVLYRFSSQAVMQAGLTSVAIGIARAVHDNFIALAKKKSPSSAINPLRDDTWIHARMAQADSKDQRRRRVARETADPGAARVRDRRRSQFSGSRQAARRVHAPDHGRRARRSR
jgi:alkylation response protein AidB-like acyl-CoA dehydrogenase